MKLHLLEDPAPILTNQPLAYSPTDEWIFPSLLDTSGLPVDAPARWLFAYSPHDAPGGICFAWGDRLDGAWREVPDNPRIARAWPPHYDVSHVASPHLLWVPERRQIACYFHGENDTTRLAFSDDGRAWQYEGVVMSTDRMPGWNLAECSYARVFPYALPSQPGSRYVMFFMGRDPDEDAPGRGTRHLFLCHSPDGIHWTPRPEPVVSPPDGWQASGPQLVTLDGRNWLLHHFDIMNGPGHLYATPLDADCRRSGPTECLLHADDRPASGGRLADPLLVRQDDALHLIWIERPRLEGHFMRARVALQ